MGILQDLRLVKEGDGAVADVDKPAGSNLDVEAVRVVENNLQKGSVIEASLDMEFSNLAFR